MRGSVVSLNIIKFIVSSFKVFEFIGYLTVF